MLWRLRNTLKNDLKDCAGNLSTYLAKLGIVGPIPGPDLEDLGVDEFFDKRDDLILDEAPSFSELREHGEEEVGREEGIQE